MAAPNLVNIQTITGKLVVQNATTTATAFVTNSSSSGKVFKINSVMVANVSSASSNVTIDVFRSSVAYKMVNTIPVPAQSSFTPIDRNTAIYLEEGDALRVTSSEADSLTVTCSYEELS